MVTQLRDCYRVREWRSEVTASHSPLLHRERLQYWESLGGEQRMKNERCGEFWRDEGTGSVSQKVVTTCVPLLDYRRVWGIWLHVPAEAIRALLVETVCVMSRQWVHSLLSTRGCSSRETNGGTSVLHSSENVSLLTFQSTLLLIATRHQNVCGRVSQRRKLTQG